MDVFYYELLFQLFVFGIIIFSAVLAAYLIKLIWCVMDVLYERRVRRRMEKRERAARLAVYRQRSEAYRKEQLARSNR